MERKAKVPGLRWHPKSGKPIWRASKAAIKAGYPIKNVPLAGFAYDTTVLEARCYRLQAEMNDWLAGRRALKPVFDGTVGHLINFYQTDKESPYHALEPASRHPYDVYVRMIVETVGKRRIDVLDGRDLKRWWNEWSAPLKQGRQAAPCGGAHGDDRAQDRPRLRHIVPKAWVRGVEADHHRGEVHQRPASAHRGSHSRRDRGGKSRRARTWSS